jgi:glycosyltransferase involved in cell wall biosynthesis
MLDTPLPSGPQVSVLIAVYNGLPYLEAALRSIMDQTLREIEIIVVDDASTDDTPAVLARLATEDPRIRVETLTENLRLPGALNRGLELVRAPLVARMDADDIADPKRLAVQKRFMDAHPDIILCGTSIRQIDAGGTYIRTSQRPRDAVCCR